MTTPPTRSPSVRTLARVAAALGGVVTLFVGGVGFLHLPVARPLLVWLLGACPFGFGTHLTVEQLDAARSDALVHVRGEAPAASRPALGFALDATTRSEVGAWATAHGLTCADDAPQLRCGGGGAELFGGSHPVDRVVFTFDAAGRVVAVEGNSDLDAAGAAERQRALTAELTTAAGPPTAQVGTPEAAWLAEAKLRAASSEFRFSDYRATVSVSHTIRDTYVVRETYQSLATVAPATAQR